MRIQSIFTALSQHYLASASTSSMTTRVAPCGSSSQGDDGAITGGGDVPNTVVAGHVKTVGVTRPGYGTSGRVVPTIVNAFSSIPDGVLYHYDVITPELPARRKIVIFNRLQQEIAPQVFVPPAVYDGRRNAFTTQRWPFYPADFALFNVTITKGSGSSAQPLEVFKVKITLVAEINANLLHRLIQGKQSGDSRIHKAITALNIVNRMSANLKYPFNLRSFFMEDGKRDIGRGLELWRGYFQAVRPSPGGLYLNLDVATGVMYKPGPLLDLCLEYLNMRDGDPQLLSSKATSPFLDRERTRLQKFISGLRITTEHMGNTKTFVVERVTAEGASSAMLTLREGGGSISVADYFKDHVNRPLKYPDVVCVEVGKAGAMIPLEFCTVPPGQIMRQTIPAEKMNDVLDFSRLHPKDRLESIRVGLSVLQSGQSDELNQLGMSVEQTPITVNARILPPPILRYGRESKEVIIQPENGWWNIRDKVFFRPCTINVWAIAIYESPNRFDQKAAREMALCFCNNARNVGITIKDLKPLLFWENGNGNIREHLMKVAKACVDAKKGLPNLLVIVLPEGGSQIYKNVKHFGDTTGIQTQCLKSRRISSRPSLKYWESVMLQVNDKLGGINHILHDSIINDPNNPLIVMGADITYEPKESLLFASLASSVDSNAAEYISLGSAQLDRQGIIDNLELMVTAALTKWEEYGKAMEKGRRPLSRIIFYRDGIPNSKYTDVLEKELPMIKNACAAKGMKPKITLVVVGKNHHVRIFPENDRDGTESGNCHVGTTIDEGIGHPTNFDYYQLTHAGSSGTNRLTHYSVIYDESRFSADALQSLTFSLCHLHAGAMHSMAIPAAVYRAHVVCSQMKNHYAIESKLNPSQALGVNLLIPGRQTVLSYWFYTEG